MFLSLNDYILRLTSAIAGRHAFFDKFVSKFLDLYTVKLLPLMAVLIYLWFRNDGDKRSRTAVIEAVISMFAAVLASRSIQNLAPLQPRPLHSGNPAFVPPIGIKMETLERWSSFPSDHAALAFALSTAVCHLSRPLGALCYVWSILVVCLPRIYAGYHYASDILGGAIIGIAAVLCVRLLLPTKAITSRMSSLAACYPGLFNAALFILMFFFATMFDDVRAAFRGLLKEG